ncbi:MAG: 3'(2'),5'-bisphosphate nucleotidase CysQ [Leptolyngbyaceae cyanobacterium SL_7_1]|nr:3'(2'),5'-bisphosphate nucleotidase CysQ [Leptolyngbyaceae cyanobacterium SL_7_1]
MQTIAGTPVSDLLAIARSLGWGASKILGEYYHGQDNPDFALDVQDKKEGPVTAADLAVNHYVLQQLQGICGTENFGYLSEETYKALPAAAPIPQDWVWILDPLDGTRDFIDRTGEFAFHLALAHRGRPIVSVVACPELKNLYYASLGGGAFVETPDGTTQPLRVSSRDRLDQLAVVASRSHRDQRFNTLLANLPCQPPIYVGSVGGKIAAIVEQRADVYLSLSGKSAPKDWDMAAPELILTEAGGQFTRADGSSLRYNTGDVNQWGCLVASNGHCHQELCGRIGELLAP